MTTTTIGQLEGKVGYLDRDGIGYRKTRATAVLATSSHYFQTKQDAKFSKVLERLRTKNFDLGKLTNRELELIYAKFDKNVTDKICGEFRFITSFGNIQDLKECTGFCDLCGKGDSRDDGANEDKLRYLFRLTNTAGGTDVWVGSSCIWQHGLHVDGAANAEEAKEILRKTLQEHIKQWKIQAWQADHPDHEDIPELWENYRKCYFNSYPVEFYSALGLDRNLLIGDWRRLFKAFRSAARFYDRKTFLSPAKTKVWDDAKALWAKTQWCFPLFREAYDLQGSGWGSQRFEKCIDFLANKKTERDARVSKRNPSRLAIA